MFERQFKLWRVLLCFGLSSAAAGAYANIQSVADESYGANEDGLAAICLDLSTKFSDVAHGVVSYAFVGRLGDTLSTVTLPAGTACSPLVGPGVARLATVPDAFGSETYTFQATSGAAETDTYNFTLTLSAVNDAPGFTAGPDQTVSEDVAPQTVSGWATGISAGPANESTQALTFDVSADNGALFSAAPSIDALSGDLTYTLAADANGAATVTVSLSDNGGTANGGIDTSPDQTFTITVSPVNDVPSFTGGTDQTADEDAGPQTVTGWASNISAGPADEAGQTLTFNVSNDNGALFSQAPSLDESTGDLTYTPAADAFGSATVSVSLSDGVDTSADQTFTITVNPVNDAPSFTAGSDQTVDEDAGPQTVAVWATGISAGPGNESSQALTIDASTNNGALFSAAPAVNPSDGELTYTPAPDANGVATVTLRISDNGGTTNGGVDTSADQSFTITVNPVNDAPSFMAGPDQTADEDAGIQTVVGWASNISPGPANESGQILTFNVSTDNDALFSGVPTINESNGDLIYAPAADAHGSATVTVNLSDGVDSSPDQTFTITVNPLNDLPSFTAGGNQTVLEDAGPQMVPGWASNLSAGPADESGQNLTFSVSTDNDALFSVLPGINESNGDLSYTPAADAHGSATVTVSLSDGVDTSADQTFTITVDSVNDAPSFVSGSDQVVDEDAGPQTVSSWATSLSSGPANEAGQVLTFNVTVDDGTLFSVTPSIDGSTGDLTYTPAADANGTVTVTVSLSDNGGVDNGGSDASADRTFTITVNPVNDAPSFGGGGDVTVLEDSGSQVVASWATVISAGPVDETGQSLTFTVVGNTNPGLFASQPTLDAGSGDLAFAPAANISGSALITIELSDDGGTANGGEDTSPQQTFTIIVGSVNDAPSFVKGSDVTVLEDAGPQAVTGWASSMSAGPEDESAQTLTFNVVSMTNGSLFSVPPAVDDATGDLTFTAAANANGTATVTINLSDDGGTANGGTNTSGNQTFTINVTPVNDPPRFTSGGDVVVPEDGGPQTVNGWAGAIARGPADENGQSLTFNVVSNSNPTLFTTQPVVDPATGNLTFEAPTQVNGSATITVVLVDNGGNADGGVDTSTPVTFVITVAPVNDEPSFVAGSDQTVMEDAGPVTEPGWATALLAGPPNESGQTLSFNIVSNTNPSLFAAGPAVNGANGDLTFTPAPNMNGTATITLSVSDNGGTGSGGDDTSPTQSFSIVVNPVNDAPTFTSGPDVAVMEDAGMQSIPWASGMSPGPADESGQALTFNIVSNDNTALFSAQPALDATTGILTFTSAPDAFGIAVITVNLSDDGGTASGGEDTSANVSFEIVVGGVNDQPVAVDDSATMAEDAEPVAIAVLNNDYLAEEPTIIVSAGVGGHSESVPVIILDDSGVEQAAPNGTVIVDGDQIYYQPKANYHGEDFFTYTIVDDNGDSATATVRVTVTPVNDPPSNVPQQFEREMLENGVLVVDAASGPLARAYDPDAAVVDPDTGEPVGGVDFSMQVVSFPAVGSLVLDPSTGAFEYTPPVDFTGDVVFEYRVSDGVLLSEDVYRVLVHVREAPEPPAPPPAGQVAIPFNLSNVPLEQSTSVPPNVLVVMDDSGSMDWNMIIADGQEGGFELDNRDFASRGLYNTSYSYLWDLRSNAYPPSSDSGRILPTPEALEAKAIDEGWGDEDPYEVWRARNHNYNRLYYNPEIQYTPWVGQDADNRAFADADHTAIRLDPVSPTNTFDLTELHSYVATRVPEWDNSGGNTRVDVVDLYIPHYYGTTEEECGAPLADGAHCKVEIREGQGPLDGGAAWRGGPQRADCAVDDDVPTTCTFEQEMQNFANYFQYYRSREYVTKNGIGKVVSRVQDIRVGYETISATTSIEIRDMNALHTEGDKKALLDNIYAVDSYGGTPLRQALGRAGKIFGCETGNYCPSLAAPEGFCQQNFTLLFSDGYWNGGTGVTGNPDGDDNSVYDGGRYDDEYPATLADVAMHYYETDIQPTLDDQVPVTVRDRLGVPDGVYPEVDAKMHQHMKTYAIAFGALGTVNPSTVPSDPSEPFDWPDPFAGNLEKIDDMLHAAVNGRGRFLNAGTPQELQAAFESTFLEFTAAASSTSSAAFNSTSLQEGTLLYRGFYDLRDNTGELTATLVDKDTGVLDPAGPRWLASEKLDALGDWSKRAIVTFDPQTRAGVAFDYDSLTPEQQITLTEDQVDFLRGDRDHEQDKVNGIYRERASRLGDIVNSSPVFVGVPRSINRDQAPYPTDDLYSDFVNSVQDRTPIVYVGANDGMLHGFDGSFDESTSGHELFAYVPNKIIDGTQGYANLLNQFTLPFYQHRYFVDLTPRLNDVYMRPSRSSVDKRWNTVLVGGLGAGGKGFFALNVTDPSRFSDSASAANTVLWEFTDEDDTYPRNAAGTPLGGAVGAITDPDGDPVKDLGYALSLPGVAMSNVDDGGSPPEKEWVAVFGNGQNSTAGTAKLFVLFMNRGLDGWTEGSDFVKIDTGFGVPLVPHPLAGYPNGLGSPAAVDRDLNGTVDWVYAGDRLGNLFRFNLEDPDPDNWTATRIFTATYDTGSGQTIQPIVTQPLVVKHPTEQGFLVIFGTGSYVTQADADSEDIQSIYAIWDRGAASPATAFPDTKALRLVEQEMTNVVDDSVSPAQTRRILTKYPVNYALEGDTPGTYGWYIDLDMPRATSTLSGGANTDTSGRSPPGAQYPGEKAIRRLLFRDGVIITTTVLPSLDEFSCFGTRPGSIILFSAVTGGDPGRPVVDFNTDGHVSSGDLVKMGDQAFAGGLLFNQSDVDGQLVDLSTLGGEGNTDWLFVSGGNDTVSFRIDDVNDSRTGRLSWRELDGSN